MDTETVTVIRPPGKDQFGDPLPGAAAEFDLGGCLFGPGPSGEAGLGANRVDTDATIYAPAGADVRAADRIRARNQLYEVLGEPQLWGSAGVVIAMKRTTG